MPYSDKVAQALVEWLPKEKSNQVRAFHCKMQANSQILYQAKNSKEKVINIPQSLRSAGFFFSRCILFREASPSLFRSKKHVTHRTILPKRRNSEKIAIPVKKYAKRA